MLHTGLLVQQCNSWTPLARRGGGGGGRGGMEWLCDRRHTLQFSRRGVCWGGGGGGGGV